MSNCPKFKVAELDEVLFVYMSSGADVAAAAADAVSKRPLINYAYFDVRDFFVSLAFKK
jgi:hypothetical protein